MTENEQTDLVDSIESSAEPGGIGKSITESFQNRANRMTSDDPDVDVSESPMSDSTPVSDTPVQETPTAEPETPAEPAPEIPPAEPAPEILPAEPVAVAVPYVTPDLVPERTPMAKPKKPPKVEVTKAPPRPKSARQTRRARLRISRVDPWSVMKTALLFGVAGWIMFIVATWVVFTVLDMTGLYDAINSTIAQIFASPTNPDDFNIRDYVNTTRATALAALVGAVNVVIITALTTIFAFLYNLTAVVMGGIEVTMAED